MTTIKRNLVLGCLVFLSKGFLLVSTVFLSLSFKEALAQPTKVVYFMAGLKDHAGPSRHETEKDLLVLQRCLDSVSNIKGVKIITKFIYGRTALDIEDMKDVDAIVIESSSEGSSAERTHPLFPPSDNKKGYSKEVEDYLDQVDSLHKNGMGIVVLHWAVAAENRKAANLQWNWFGGGFIPAYSNNPLGMWKITPVQQAKKHPVLQGVGPWTYKDELFSRFMVIPGDPHRTNLLMGEAASTNQGPVESRCVTWAYEKGKSRALLFGGMDYHSALLIADYRRFLLNAIVWAAGIEVPEGGVTSDAKGLQLVASVPDRFDEM